MTQAMMTLGLVVFILVIIFQLMYVVITILCTKKNESINLDLSELKMSILIPAYNEETVLKNCINSLNMLNYKNYEAIIINDGSSDETMNLLEEILMLESIDLKSNSNLKYSQIKGIYKSLKNDNIIVIDKYNGGKADSLNAGSDFSTGDVIITLDADSILEPNSLLHINEKFHDENVIAAGGMVHIGQMIDENDKPIFKGKALLKYQLSEYLTSFYVRKFTQSKLNVMAIVSGAFGAFRKDVLYDIGGYKKTLGEDMEITLNIQKVISASKGKLKMIFIPEAICYTEVPENVFDMFKQRTRWQKGFIDCIVKYRKDFFSTLGIKFSLFLIWDSLAMAVLGVITVMAIPIMIISDNVTNYYLACLALSILMQLLFRTTGYWAASKYDYNFSKISYVRIILFFIAECFVRPFIDSFIFLYGSLSYFLKKDKHQWNKVKRLGNVTTKNI